MSWGYTSTKRHDMAFQTSFFDVSLYVGCRAVNSMCLLRNLNRPRRVWEILQEVNNIISLVKTSHRVGIDTRLSFWGWILDIWRIQRWGFGEELVERAYGFYRLFSRICSLSHNFPCSLVQAGRVMDDAMRRVGSCGLPNLVRLIYPAT